MVEGFEERSHKAKPNPCSSAWHCAALGWELAPLGCNYPGPTAEMEWGEGHVWFAVGWENSAMEMALLGNTVV